MQAVDRETVDLEITWPAGEVVVLEAIGTRQGIVVGRE